MTLAAAALVPAVGHNPDLANVQPGVLATYERIQQRFGRDLPITSGFRSPERNRRAGGASKSQHIHGAALDVRVSDLSKADRKRLIQIASEEGITGIGVYGNGLHFDIGPRRAWGPSHGRKSVPGWARGVIGNHLAGKFQKPADNVQVAQANTANDASGVTFDDIQRMVEEADRRDAGAAGAPTPLGSAQRPTQPPQGTSAPQGSVTFEDIERMVQEADQSDRRQIDPNTTQAAQGGLGARINSGVDQVMADAAESQQPGILEQAGDWVRRKVVGDSELDVAEIEAELSRRSPGSSPMAQAVRNAYPLPGVDVIHPRDQEMESLRSRLMMAETEADMVPILAEAFPESEFGVDGNNNRFINLDGQWFALDKSGLSGRDLQEVVKEGPALIGGAALGVRLGLRALGSAGGRTIGAGAGTAAGDAMVQTMNIASGSGADFNSFRTAMAGAFGAGGEVIASGLGRILGSIVSSRNTFSGGRITAAGRAQLERAGIDPEVISDNLAASFRRRIREANGATDEAARLAIADEFNLPLTRGQATGDVSQSAFEEAARNDARGKMALSRVQTIDGAAQKRVGEAVDDIGAQLGSTPDNALVAAERAGEAIKSAADVYRQAADDAYTALSQSGATAPGRAALDLGNRLKRAVEMNGHIIDDATPNAVKAVQFINQRFAGGARGAVEFGRIEATRQQINRFTTAASKGSNGADETAMLQIKQGYDTWMDRLFTRAMMDGDPAILEKAKAARGAWTAWKRNFFKQGQGDDTGRAIQNIVEKDMTGTEVANLLYGGVAVGEKGSSVRLAAKLKTLLPKDAWNNIRAGAWLRVAEASAGKQAFGPEKMAGRIEALISGEGSAMAKVLYTPEERALMGRFARALKILVPPKEATNPSKTGYANARLGQDMFRSFATMLGLSDGGVSGGIGAAILSSVPEAVRNSLKATGISATRATGPARGGVGGGVTGGNEAEIRGMMGR